MGLFSANRFKNLCPEYVQEALDLAKQDQNKQPEAPVAQSETPGKEGADDPKPTESHIKQEAVDVSDTEEISVDEAAYLDYLLESLDSDF